ncbi:fructosyl amino acid oxidase [Fusarium heterosporum]|uniref:Fructosyl amino acid oxidase n=1 Tax=Fusarium heterosporum TaxID=42747 RepID=A0A8H5SJL8_FUSHE|nr:fructosyl amino acid oxidase [Fusarium heterosporum]
MTSRKPVAKNEPIVIIGAGVFGLSTALELTKRGYEKVTVLDRFLPPVVDGSSVDISRVIRLEYADPFYGKMAQEALEGWVGNYSDHYHQSGFVMLTKASGNSYIEQSLESNRSLGVTMEDYANANDLRKRFPAVQAKLDGMKAYYNKTGGWADAESAIRQLAMECSLAGVSFITGARGRALSLRYSGNKVTGVNVAEGEPISAAQVILSTGAWSNRLLPLSHASSGSGQPVGFIRLTPEEAEKLAEMPVMINLSTGIFIFPPTPKTHILKIARHGYGWATEIDVTDPLGQARTVSTPKYENNASANYLPEDALEALREGLQQLVPEIGNREWLRTRLCWYSDTPEGDFIVDHHPIREGLFLATGGAGHAFKFLPVLGRYVADCFEDKAPKELRHKWRLRAPTGQDMVKQGDGSRGGPPLRKLTRTEQAKL